MNNPNVCMVIFDTTVKHGEGFGVYMLGNAKMLDEDTVIEQANDLMKKKLNATDSRKAEYYLYPNPRRIYEFSYDEMWINVRILENDQWIDKRTYINI